MEIHVIDENLQSWRSIKSLKIVEMQWKDKKPAWNRAEVSIKAACPLVINIHTLGFLEIYGKPCGNSYKFHQKHEIYENLLNSKALKCDESLQRTRSQFGIEQKFVWKPTNPLIPSDRCIPWDSWKSNKTDKNQIKIDGYS